MKHSLEVFDDQKLIFFSDGKWLHPLFELENFLKENDYQSEMLIVKDKIVGKAAALILVYLGVKNIQAGTLSKIALTFLEETGIKFSYNRLIERIACRTEDLLLNENSPEAGYMLVSELRKKALKK